MSKITLKSIFSGTDEDKPEVVKEVLRGFSLNKFKKMCQDMSKAVGSPEDERMSVVDATDYAGKYLPFVGKGSSRYVWALSGKTVLKIARPGSEASFEKGIAQNEAEVDIFSNPKTKNVVAKIYDFSPDYYWLVSEVAKPFKTDEDFETLTGIGMGQFSSMLAIAEHASVDERTGVNIFEELKDVSRRDLQEYKEDIKRFKTKKQDLESYLELVLSEPESDAHKREIAFYEEEIDIHDENIELRERHIQELEKKILGLENVGKNKQFTDFFNDIAELSISSELLPADITRADQLGTTADGRLVLLDYGFTEDVMSQYYSESVEKNIEKTGASLGASKINPAAGLAAITEAYQRARRRLLGQ